ncbi:MAG TPA: hypothetical protein VF247_09375 [Candidatus Krumholzibacteria bacterium]
MKPRLLIPLFVVFALIAPGLASAAGSVAAKKLDAAAAAFQKESWSEALSLYRELAAENPDNGYFWSQIGTAQYNLKQYREAIASYERAAAIGFQAGACNYNKACCLALLGEKDAAIDALQLAIRAGLRNREQMLREDKDLDSLRDTPEFRARILPAVMPETSRADAWKIDLDYLTKRVEETHYAPWRNISRDEWNAEIARIEAAVPTMKDHEVVTALMQLVVRLGDGHSTVFPPREGKYAFHQLPVRFYEFSDGIFVREAHPDYAALVGKRVVRIGRTPVQDALAKVATTVQRDNSQQVKWLAPVYMSRIETLDALGISKGLDGADITVADAKGKETTVRVKAVPLPAQQHGVRVTPADWMDMAAKTDSPPLWRKDPDNIFTADYLPDSKIVYANFRAVANWHDEKLGDFGTRVVNLAESKSARALVIDVRLNNGGNNFLGRAFFEEVLKSDFNADGKLFVICGRETFSACQNFCNWMDRQTAAIFAGEPTGSRPNFVGEGNEIWLPYSGIAVNASSRLWQDSVSEDVRTWIAPELAAAMSSEDYRNNRDPAFAGILEYLGTRADAATAGAKP